MRWTKRPDAVTREIAQVVEFRRVISFDSSALAAALRDLPARSAVIIVSAGGYRSREASGSRQIDEDRWVPHTVIAARIAMAHAKAAECYVALDVGHWQPVAQRNADLLASVDDCGVLAASPTRSRAEHLASRVDDWENSLRRGDVERVASEVSRISGDSLNARIDLQAQLLMRAGRAKLAFELLLRHGAYAAPENSGDRLLFLLHVAAQANKHRVASELASRIALTALDVDELETLLGLALLGLFTIDVSELA
ncbi:MAG TPA: hypothetical protein VK932_10965, partial [Kofleriaceae bacterium]|nr:hypothetical protein [Kofleriaceae bacterium]